MPRFTIIVVHCQAATPHAIFCRGIASLKAQTFTDYEILCYHDGPLLDPALPMPMQIIPTATRHKDWGHSLRDRGLREAKGEYIVHFNSDNVLYPNALMEIDKEISRPIRLCDKDGKVWDPPDIVVFPILMRGYQINSNGKFRFPNHHEFFTIYTGVPVKRGETDCLQFVMRRDLWLAEGGWYDKTYEGDSIMYEKFAEKYGYRNVGPVLGEHW